MDNVSVSKGVFAMKGRYRINARRRRVENNFFINESWYKAYAETWRIIKDSVEAINFNMFKQILSDLQNYVGNIRDVIRDDVTCEIPAAILLTGVNLPDHEVLFRKLASKVSSITRHIAVIPSRDSSNIKNLIEETVYQLINYSNEEDVSSDVKKSQCTLRLLQSWYFEKCDINTPLVIIIPDFESFNSTTLRDFILVLSSYAKTMKFVLVFGVATTLHAVHRCLSYDVTSKLRVQVFHTPTQLKSLSDVLEGTVLSGNTPFKLTGRAFALLTDIFLYYDFSVDNFLQGYKLCMFHHFYGNNIMSLCCERENIKDRLDELTDDDLDELKKLPSIDKYMKKNYENQFKNMNEKVFKNIIAELLNKFHDSMSGFFPILKCFHHLTHSLPGAPMGKQLREYYASAVTCDLTQMPEYKECMQVLNFMSQEELVLKLKNLLEIIKSEKNKYLNEVETNLKSHLNIIRNASLEATTTSSDIVTLNQNLNRQQLSKKLLEMSQKQSRSPFKQAQLNLMNYLEKIFVQYLINPNRLAASEIFCFSDANTAKHHIKGSLRAAIHTGLNDPHVYLNCDCCRLENEETIQPTLPDLSIIYKLHLESKKLINMYDWLQAFLTIVSPKQDTNAQREIDPQIQARFTRAVAELQFLGFIKTSRRKTDHVKRLT